LVVPRSLTPRLLCLGRSHVWSLSRSLTLPRSLQTGEALAHCAASLVSHRFSLSLSSRSLVSLSRLALSSRSLVSLSRLALSSRSLVSLSRLSLSYRSLVSLSRLSLSRLALSSRSLVSLSRLSLSSRSLASLSHLALSPRSLVSLSLQHTDALGAQCDLCNDSPSSSSGGGGGQPGAYWRWPLAEGTVRARPGTAATRPHHPFPLQNQTKVLPADLPGNTFVLRVACSRPPHADSSLPPNGWPVGLWSCEFNQVAGRASCELRTSSPPALALALTSAAAARHGYYTPALAMRLGLGGGLAPASERLGQAGRGNAPRCRELYYKPLSQLSHDNTAALFAVGALWAVLRWVRSS
jgi:hypothetical protein